MARQRWRVIDFLKEKSSFDGIKQLILWLQMTVNISL